MTGYQRSVRIVVVVRYPQRSGECLLLFRRSFHNIGKLPHCRISFMMESQETLHFGNVILYHEPILWRAAERSQRNGLGALNSRSDRFASPPPATRSSKVPCPGRLTLRISHHDNQFLVAFGLIWQVMLNARQALRCVEMTVTLQCNYHGQILEGFAWQSPSLLYLDQGPSNREMCSLGSSTW
jgi:hypothetical protein